MTALTKIFVVLSVVLSLLITAATVVYVNKEDGIKQAAELQKSELAKARDDARRADEQLIAAQQNATAIQQQANAQATAASDALARADQKIAQLNVDLAKASSQAAAQQLDISRLTEATNALQAMSGRMQEEVGRLRGDNDQLVRQSSELNASVSDLTNKLEVTERERRNLAEQMTQTSARADELQKIVAGAGLSPAQQQTAANRSGLPLIKGIIKDKRLIAGNQYATISVGAADGVQRGLEFKVVDRNTGDFLGTIVIDSVEAQESTGRLFGPKIAQITPGPNVEVRTQL